MRSLKSLLGSSLIDGRTDVQGRVVAFRDLLPRFIAHLKARAAIAREELVLVADIGGGTSDFSIVRLLPEAGVAATGIDTLFFTGGSSGIPLLRRRIAAMLPQARVVEGDLFGSIGAGLAVDAARRYGCA